MRDAKFRTARQMLANFQFSHEINKHVLSASGLVTSWCEEVTLLLTLTNKK